MKNPKSVTLLTLLIFSLIAFCSPAAFCYITPGVDYYKTVEPTEIIFGSESLEQIPADFFGPGSDPFDGIICLKGKPIDPCHSDTDTIIERLTPPDACGIVELEIVSLDLVSTAPITVTYYGGSFPADSFFDVYVTLNPIFDSNGIMKGTKTHANGGTYDSVFNVQPRFEFREVDGVGPPLVWEPYDPINIKSSYYGNWQDTPLPHSVPPGNDFYPITEEPHIMDIGFDSGRLSLMPATDGNDYDYKTYDLLPYGVRVKWAQPPFIFDPCEPIYLGWNEYGNFVADDFRCDSNKPITMIRWWGSFENWHDEMIPPPEELPNEFHLTIWTNVPPDYADPESFSRPHQIIHEIYCDEYDVEFYGWEENPETGEQTAKFMLTQFLDPCDYWYQPGDWDIYWLGIEPIYSQMVCADCNADSDGDGDVDTDDQVNFMACFGLPPVGDCQWADLNCDGLINMPDLPILSCQMSEGWPDPNCCDPFIEPIEPNFPFGVETRPHYFADDAVRIYSEMPLDQPTFMPIKDTNGFSWDLSFKLGTGEKKEIVQHLKWSQPPLETVPMYETANLYGFDLWSVAPADPCNDPINPGPMMWLTQADDFRCIGNMPVTSIHWWGSFYNWPAEYYYKYNMLPPQPSSFWIGFWSNTLGGTAPFEWSRPNELLWQKNFPANRIETQWFGDDISFYAGQEGWLDFDRDVCFQYNLELRPHEYFRQSEFEENTIDNIFWISIVAIYDEPVYGYQWGWKTRPVVWEDAAVTTWLPDNPQPGMILTPDIWLQTTPFSAFFMGGPVFYIDRYWDLSFELDTDPNYIKFEQPFTTLRDWQHYEEAPSMALESDGEPTIIQMEADDWLCTKRTPVTAISWAGSYRNYTYNPAEPNFLGKLLPNKPDYFLLSIWTDVPVDDPCNTYPYSHPGRKVWEYRAYDYDEVMVGYDSYIENLFPLPVRQQPVYRYSVRLPREDFFFQPQYEKVYWLSIVAVYSELNDPIYTWGWTNHKHNFNDDAVIGQFIPHESRWDWNEIFDQTGESADLSFVLFTDPDYCTFCADYELDGIVNTYDLSIFVDNWLWTGLPGGYNDGDLNCDGSVTFFDYAIFAMQWLESCP